MLQLQRASAGSGKTYTLAKKFIWYLIAIKDKDRSNTWRLRAPREIADGLQRILAITFTNKATNEMKLRIVQKLADLARADSDSPLSEEQLKHIDYLKEFATDLSTEYRNIGRAAKEALSVLLNEYSDFKVSTIDSFFQTVLRTFAYESNLNDTYQVEINSDYLAAAAVNATLDEIDSTDPQSIPRFWLHQLMEEESAKGSKNWNVFQKSTSDNSLYTQLLESVKRLESEDFKQVREKLDEYFNNPDTVDPLRIAYENAIRTIRQPAEQQLAKAKEAAVKLKRLFEKNGLDPAKVGIGYIASHLNNLSIITVDTYSDKSITPLDMKGKTSVFKTKGSGKKKKPIASCADDEEMLALACEMYEAYSNFLNIVKGSEWRHWEIYKPQFPYLGLIGVIRTMMKEHLDATNTIQLGETNSMLRRIIGKDDAPFIYERLGARLNHFLIDEFQDTSRLQWENLLPLLHESDGRGEDNLIIGDAKQSIYRFRNADPSLITSAVPEEFPDRMDAGMSKEENTNWRSKRTIVEFNNYLFYALMRRMAEFSMGVVDFPNLYANVAQYPSHRDHSGYIEVNFLEAPEMGKDAHGKMKKLSSEEKKDFLRNEALSHLGPLITSLLQRGYHQRDVAILVRVNSLAKEVIDTLVNYNNTPDIPKRIEFISEESLLVSSSEAVGIIIGVLGKMAEGTSSPNPDSDNVQSHNAKKSSKTKWAEIKCNFNFYAMRHPELSPAEQVEGFLKDDSPVDAVNVMLRSMQTVALPALVEAITENFVPEHMRRSQAVFIAALQDMVLEYCDSHATDIFSFLDWWRIKGIERSISSPEGTDAVQIMTIHKSKGLEFKCVIIPYDNASLIPQKKSEWKWVRPAEPFIKLGFPPFIPVATTSALKETEHNDVYSRFFDLSTMDMLNSYYVAFTRAVNELYVFTSKPEDNPKKNSFTLGRCLNEFFTDSPNSLFGDKITEMKAEVEDEEAKSNMLPSGIAEWDDSHSRLTIGTPLAKAVIIEEEEKERKKNKTTTTSHIIEEYHVDSSPSVLHYVEGDDEKASTQLPDADDNDPRSEGNLLHSIMSMVNIPTDLHRAILRHKMQGLITNAQAEEWESLLEGAMAEPEVEKWFRPGWRVLNERSMLFPGKENRRPDRVLIAPDKSHGIIIDYKFGEIPSDNRHITQVKQYIDAFREITHIHNVKGYIWYVKKGRIIPVASSLF